MTRGTWSLGAAGQPVCPEGSQGPVTTGTEQGWILPPLWSIQVCNCSSLAMVSAHPFAYYTFRAHIC